MKRLLTAAAFVAAAFAGWAGQVSAQVCGVNVDCDWQLPDVSYWSFDETSGGTVFDQVNTNNGIWQGDFGSNEWSTGLINGGARVNDEDGGNGQEHFDVASMPQLNGASALSISLWFNMNVDNNNNSNYNGLFMTRDLLSSFGGGSENWGIALENNNTPRHIDWRIDGAAGPEENVIEGNVVDQWHHVVFTWDGADQGDGFGERVLYVDGAELFREDAPIGTITTSGSWDIGNDSCCNSREFTGTLDETAVWSTVLSSTSAINLYNAGLQGITVSKIEPPLPGDVDDDGDIDLTDVAVINNAFFQEVGSRAEGDLNSDGVVDWADFAQWKENYTGGGGSATVPEPSAALLLVFGLAASAARRIR